jgi:hypothetical protein
MDNKNKKIEQIMFPIHSLYNTDISKYLKLLKIRHEVVAKDNIPSRLPKGNFALVINLDDSNSSGTHWVCLIQSTKKQNLLYYDSFGVEHPPQQVIDLENRRGIVANNSQHQDVESILCGYYCCRVIKRCLYDNMSYINTMKEFKDNPHPHNEDIADDLFL